jgi:hypothetical protein
MRSLRVQELNNIMQKMLNLKYIFSPPLEIKITDETNSNLNKYIKPLLNELETYKVRRQLKGKNVELIIPLSFEKAVYNNSCDEIKQIIESYGYSSSDVNGHFCNPIDNKSVDFKIIINKNIQYFSTIFHEFTHVIDFNDYIKYYGNPDLMSKIQKRENYFFEFYLWTEYNAKRIGMRRLMVEYKKNEWSIALEQTTINFTEKVSIEHDSLRRRYYLVHFFARLSECRNKSLKFNSEIYPRDFLEKYFGANVFKLHNTLEKIKSFDDFQNKRKKLKRLVNY